MFVEWISSRPCNLTSTELPHISTYTHKHTHRRFVSTSTARPASAPPPPPPPPPPSSTTTTPQMINTSKAPRRWDAPGPNPPPPPPSGAPPSNTTFKFNQFHQRQPLPSQQALLSQKTTTATSVTTLPSTSPFASALASVTNTTAGNGKGATAVTTMSSAATSDWPPGLRDYVERSFAACKTEEDRLKTEQVLKSVILQAKNSNTINKKKWELEQTPLSPGFSFGR